MELPNRFVHWQGSSSSRNWQLHYRQAVTLHTLYCAQIRRAGPGNLPTRRRTDCRWQRRTWSLDVRPS